MVEKSYILKFSISSKEHTTIPLYKRKKQIFKHIDELKNQLKENEGLKGRDYSLKTLSCHAPAANRAYCTLTIEEAERKGIDWFPDRIHTYNNIIWTEGKYDKLGSQFKSEELRKKMKDTLQRNFTEEELKEKYNEIKHMKWLKTAGVQETFLSPFKITPSTEDREEEWINAIDSTGLSSDAANKLYEQLRS